MPDRFDIAIVGAGLVGASLAAALEDSGLSVALIEPQSPPRPPADGSWDSRVYTVSPGAAALLEACGAWQTLPRERVTAVEAMRIYGDDPAARLEFSAYDAGVSELAFIVENRVLAHALWQRLSRSTHVALFAPAACALAIRQDAALLTLADGTALAAKLVVGADGADSWVRTQAAIAVVGHDYAQMGVVANFACARPHRGVAFQWFRRDGVLALLPLPGERVSMVWSTGEAHASKLLALGAGELAGRVSEASRASLGELSTITAPAAFPLRLQRVAQLVKPRLALAGDAAHNVHPLAGQGVNLGFRDVRELARVLATRGAQTDCGDYRLLRRYERARKEDIAAMRFTTDMLQKLFASNVVCVAMARNLGLTLVDRRPQIKQWLAEHAMA
ncbi:MAG: UbiH/UbiF family hydroxylase [Betaproteobacteria bacterium]|nr:UbiH/UbiF family hydroxylase [Betaproteobacteria bacterium]